MLKNKIIIFIQVVFCKLRGKIPKIIAKADLYMDRLIIALAYLMIVYPKI